MDRIRGVRQQGGGVRRRAAFAVAAVLAVGAAHGAAPPGPSPAPVPAGEYRVDPAHTSVLFRVDHLGFSHYVGRFTATDARLSFDPANPARSRVDVTIETRSLSADNAPDGFLDTLRGPEWLDAAKFPTITYHSTRVTARGKGRLAVEGTLTLHGVTRPVALEATYNGGWAGHPMDPHARIGFSARGSFRRSAFGVDSGIPAPGSTLGVGDLVTVTIEAEFTGPPLPAAPH
jgi:polyisoprenoid-binding protein YceI